MLEYKKIIGLITSSKFRMLSSSYIGEAVIEHLASIPNHMNPKALRSWGCFKKSQGRRPWLSNIAARQHPAFACRHHPISLYQAFCMATRPAFLIATRQGFLIAILISTPPGRILNKKEARAEGPGFSCSY